MRIAIYGAGSLGTVLGAYISKNAGKSGLDLGKGIELYNRNIKHIEALRKNGAHIIGTTDFVQKVNAFLPQEMEGEFDYIFLMTKQLDNKKTIEFLMPHLKKDGAICTTQNGLPEPDIADIIGKDRTLGCTIAWGATMTEPGVSTLTSSTDALTFGLGAPYSEGKKHIDTVKKILELMGPVVVEENFIGARWSKLLINAAYSGMSAVINGTFGDVCKNPVSRKCAQAIMKECIDVTHAAGIKIEPVQGKDIVKLFDYNNAAKKLFGYLLIPIAMKKHKDIRASMLFDLERGKLCEVDAINGSVCKEGDKVNVDTPFCDLVVKTVHGFEQGIGKPAIENLKLFEKLLK